MIDTLFTFSNKRGQSFSINDHTNPNKVIALQSYPESSTEFKNNEVVPQGQHGVWSFYSYYGSKVTTFSGVIVAETHQEIVQLEETMKTVLGLPIQPTNTDDGFVSVSYTLNGEEFLLRVNCFRQSDLTDRLLGGCYLIFLSRLNRQTRLLLVNKIPPVVSLADIKRLLVYPLECRSVSVKYQSTH